MLKEYIQCNKCSNKVYKSDLPNYDYLCKNCDENLYKFETHFAYEKVLSKKEFDQLCEIFEKDYEDTLESFMLDYLTNFKQFLKANGLVYTKRLYRQLYYLINNK